MNTIRTTPFSSEGLGKGLVIETHGNMTYGRDIFIANDRLKCIIAFKHNMRSRIERG